MTQFDPNAAASADSGVFGLPFTEAQSALVLVPVAWEATTSYGGGTSQGPQAIFQASKQVDLFDLEVNKPYEAGIFLRSESELISKLNAEAKELAQPVIEAGGVSADSDPSLVRGLARVNEMGGALNEWVAGQTRELLAAGKLVGIVGGDHSVPFGAFQAIAEKHGSFGILHFDAHSDTRNAYEGFQWSHASIMHNALERISGIKKLVQVGIRDVCEEEVAYCESQGTRVKSFFDRNLAMRKFKGESWDQIARDIVESLPEKVWISFDIDGLDPRFCPNTGTPVPGGLDFHEACYVISLLGRSNKKIIGFDLNEVAPAADGQNEWDANVGARLLYKLSAWTLASQGLVEIRD